MRFHRSQTRGARGCRTRQKSWRRPGIPPRLIRLALLGMLNRSVFWDPPDGLDSAADVGQHFADIFLPPRA